MSLYTYTSGKGKQKLMGLSEGSRESLRRLSSFTWMAEELLQVTDYYLPSKPILEIGQPGNGAATAIIFFGGQLFVGYSSGTIRAWDIKGQRAVVIREVKEHKRAVTCFALSDTGENLLSGSADKSIRVWKMAQRKLECVEVIQIREAVEQFEIYNDKIIVLTPNNVLKFSYSSRSTQTFYKSKHVKSLAVAHGKAYLGCTDLSIQELDVAVGSKIEIRAPTRSWRIRKQPISSIVVYKDWMYCAGTQVEGSTIKDWKKRCKPTMTMAISKGTNVEAMAVVEDFIYLNCDKSPSIIQIWLRENQQKVGRLSAGNKITSMFTANDIIFCGTETGLIKHSPRLGRLSKGRSRLETVAHGGGSRGWGRRQPRLEMARRTAAVVAGSGSLSSLPLSLFTSGAVAAFLLAGGDLNRGREMGKLEQLRALHNRTYCNNCTGTESMKALLPLLQACSVAAPCGATYRYRAAHQSIIMEHTTSTTTPGDRARTCTNVSALYRSIGCMRGTLHMAQLDRRRRCCCCCCCVHRKKYGRDEPSRQRMESTKDETCVFLMAQA
uniref:Uncharacterized protein n=2 Tax=Oryza sativa subsp. japonica TaxID=39947 RepID=Q60E76_ORYSJ|nr:unknown protein [Oryza sativa Japonica Group]